MGTWSKAPLFVWFIIDFQLSTEGVRTGFANLAPLQWHVAVFVGRDSFIESRCRCTTVGKAVGHGGSYPAFILGRVFL